VQPRVKVKFVDKNPNGIAMYAEEIGGLFTVSVGVHDPQAKEMHSEGTLTKGAVAAIHELGLSGRHRTRRAWLSQWADTNQPEMHADMKKAMADVAARRAGRKKAFERVGKRWAEDVRKFVGSGQVKPPLKPSTVARKGHSTPLLDSADMINAVQYRVYLPRTSSVASKAARGG
jgi:hypothetical protein